MTRQEILDLLAICESQQECFHPCSAIQSSTVARMSRNGELVAAYPQLYARTDYWMSISPNDRHRHVARTLSRIHPGWIFCGITAAALWGLDPSERLLDTIHVTTEGTRRHGTRWLTTHQLRNAEPTFRHSIPVTSLRRTAYDCARTLSFTEGLVIADAALRTSGMNRDELVAYMQNLGKQGSSRGQKHALVTASYANPLSESGLESAARATMIRLGMQAPKLQAELPDLFGTGSYRVDFLWKLGAERFVIGEADGYVKYEDPSMNGGSSTKKMLAERQRESRLTALGMPVMRFTRQIARNPQELERLMTAFGIPRVSEAQPVPSFNDGSDW